LVSAEAIIELLGVTTATYSSRRREDQNKFSRMLESDRDIAEFLRGREQQAPVRLDVKNTDVPINFGDYHGVDVLGGYMAGLPENLIRSEAHSERSKTVLAVTHDMAKAPDREGQVSLYEGKSGLKVFRNPETRPRAWSVHQAIPATILAGLRDRLQVQPLDVHRQTILLAETPALESCDGDVIKTRQPQPQPHALHRRRLLSGLGSRRGRQARPHLGSLWFRPRRGGARRRAPDRSALPAGQFLCRRSAVYDGTAVDRRTRMSAAMIT